MSGDPMSSDEKFWLWMWGLGAAVVLALTFVISTINAPDWQVDRELTRECAKRGGVRIALSAQPQWRAGCYAVRSLDNAAVAR